MRKIYFIFGLTLQFLLAENTISSSIEINDSKYRSLQKGQLNSIQQINEAKLLKHTNNFIYSTVYPGLLGNGSDQVSKQYIKKYFGMESITGIKEFEKLNGCTLKELKKSEKYKEIFDQNFIAARNALLKSTPTNEINLNSKRLKAVPIEILQLKGIQNLDLSNNYLNHLPSNFGTLTSLKILNLAINRFKALPIEVLSLINLKSLRLDTNQIEGLPVNLGNLNKLEFLQLSGNRLEALPRSLLTLGKTLKLLDISNNHFFLTTPEGTHGLLEMRYYLKNAQLYSDSQTPAAHIIGSRKIKMDYVSQREMSFNQTFISKQQEIDNLKLELKSDHEKRLQLRKKMLKNLKMQLDIEKQSGSKNEEILLREIKKLKEAIAKDMGDLEQLGSES